MKGNTVRALEQAGLTVHEAFRVLGATCTDGPLGPEWKEGWAVHPFVGGRDKPCHWWTRTPGDHCGDERVLYLSARMCAGRDSVIAETKPVRLLAPGNFRRCMKCERLRGLRVRVKSGRR